MENNASERSSQWMETRGWKPQQFQLEAWNALAQGHHGLVNAPTGAGKTYSLLLPFILSFPDRQEIKGLQMIWITPIKALAKEIQVAALRVVQSSEVRLSVGIRTGDTSEEERAAQRKALPNLLITTPESLHLLLAQKGAKERLASCALIVADEWHELLGTKRGVMLELALGRLAHWSLGLKIWGISATIGNLNEALHVLLTPRRANAAVLIKANLKKQIEVISILPDEVERMPWAGHLGVKMAEKLLPVIEKSQSTLIFTNTRAQCEIWYKAILDKDISLAGNMAMHHGSVSRDIRHWVEEAIYEGKLKAVVCTSSLDLGVDFAPVEAIVQIGGPKGVSRFVQRAGRSGHRPNTPSEIYFLPTHSLELIEAAALREAIDQNYLESRPPLVNCFDVLLQYLVTLSLGDGFIPNEVWEEVKSTFCFQEMNDAEWKWCLAFITHGGLSLQAYPDYHKVKVEDGVYKIANQRLARRHRLSIGAIVGDTMIAVKMNRGGLVGHVEESFVASLNEGDTFWFAGQGWQLIRVKELTAFVKKSDKKTGKIPSYQGGRLPLSSKMSDMLRFKLNEAMEFGEKSKDAELRAIQPILKLQQERSHVPRKNEFLVEVFESKDGYHALFYGFEGRFVHEGLASLFAWRIGQYQPISFSLAYNDYGFELLSDQPFDVEMAIEKGLFNAENLQRDLFASVNSTELARRRFREIAAIAGLIFKGYPGQQIKDRHIQSSAQLIFNVLEDYEKDHLLLRQAYDEVIQFQLEIDRLRAALQRIKAQDVLVATPDRPTPFAFPIMVDRLREKMSTESLEDRVKRMVLDLEG